MSLSSIYLSSACNKYYRKEHLPINRIAVIPYGGYRKEERQSITALKWLKWISKESGERIHHKVCILYISMIFKKLNSFSIYIS